MKYYNLKNILKKEAQYNLIIGERSNGKTYAVLKYGVEQFIKTGGQLAILRRWREDIIGKRAQSIFSSLVANGEIAKITNGEYDNIYYNSGRYYLCYYEDGKAIHEDEPFAFVFALSDMEHNKSNSYPKITNILFDEFITKFVYLKDEFILFMNSLSTIIRDRDNVKIFMCGNTVNKHNPYFQEMGLTNALKMEQGSIDTYTYGNSKLRVAIEYCSNNFIKKSNVYFAFDNPKLQMITTGKWEFDIYPHIEVKYNKSDIVYIFFIEFNSNLYQCEIISKDNDYFTYIHRKTSGLQKGNNLVYTLDKNSENIYNISYINKPFNKLTKKIWNMFALNKVFYQDNEVGHDISNYLKMCGR